MANLRIILAVAAVINLGLTGAAWAQQTPSPLQPAPGRVLTLDECIAIALEAQPRIQATLSDYAAARYRVNQALSPLLPQLPGLVTTTQSQGISATPLASTSRQLPHTFPAPVSLSQLPFDFAKN